MSPEGGFYNGQRSIAEYSDAAELPGLYGAAVEPEKLKAIVEAGTWAASGMGRQAPKIVVLTDPAEIAELDAEEKKMFLDDLGIAESGLDRLVKASYSLLGLISYLTSGEDECRAWTIKRGTKAPRPRARSTPISREASSRRKL